MSIITIFVEEVNGIRTPIEAPTDMNLSLMEILKASDYDIHATCGGIAMCATCHIQILEGEEALKEASEAEWVLFDTLPTIPTGSRLACQMRLVKEMDGLVIRPLAFA